MMYFWFKMTQELVFKRGNLVGDDHPVPAIAEVLLLVSCSHPSSIVLIADEPGTSSPSVKLYAVTIYLIFFFIILTFDVFVLPLSSQ